MADYREDSSISDAPALKKAGGAISWFGKALNFMRIVPEATGSMLGQFGVIPALVGGGDALKAVGELSDHNYKKAGKLFVKAAVETATVMAETAFLGGWFVPVELASLLLTGKFAATLAGDTFGGVIDGVDKPKADPALFGVPASIQVVPPTQPMLPPSSPIFQQNAAAAALPSGAPAGGWENYVAGRRGAPANANTVTLPPDQAAGWQSAVQRAQDNPQAAQAVG